MKFVLSSYRESIIPLELLSNGVDGGLHEYYCLKKSNKRRINYDVKNDCVCPNNLSGCIFFRTRKVTNGKGPVIKGRKDEVGRV